MRIGFLVNPIAGMGGRVGLKGTDGWAYREAIKRGAEPVAPKRAQEFLSALKSLCRVELLVAPGIMGEDEARAVEYPSFSVVGGSVGNETSREDTIRFARAMIDEGVGLLVFVGGDGTARDVLDATKGRIPVLGVPSGVKMYSSVFAVNPRAAARVVALYAEGKAAIVQGEVMDIDEEAFRRNRLSVKLYGFMPTIACEGLLQASKEPSRAETELDNMMEIAEYLVEEVLKPDVLYFLGPGSTVKAVADALGVEKTLLGVDAVINGRLVGKDLDERGALEVLSRHRGPAAIIVTPIGGQGFLFGRGNQQISPRVIRAVGIENVIIIATRRKMRKLRRLLVDTGDPELDRLLSGYRRVIVGYREEIVVKVESPS